MNKGMKIKFIETRDIVLKLKRARKEKNLSYDQILKLLEEIDQFMSKSTLSRVFADGSEEKSFRYEETLRPLAAVLLDEEVKMIEYVDPVSSTSCRSSIQNRIAEKDFLIEELLNDLDMLKSLRIRDKQEFEEKRRKDKAQFENTIEFLKEQISRKDCLIERLVDACLKSQNPIV